MTDEPGTTLAAFLRSGLVLAGLLLLGVGIGNVVAGHSKIGEYEEVLRTSPAPPPPDPAVLFPKPSEALERRELARAKLAFYQLLLSAGQLLSALGVVLLAAGMLRLRLRALRAAPGSPAAN
jgi:hypothetical protein